MDSRLLDEDRVMQICFVTYDLEKSAQWFADLTGKPMPTVGVAASPETAQATYHGQPATYLMGFVSSVFVAVGSIGWSLRKEQKRTARELLNEGFEHENFTAVAGASQPLALGVLLFVAGAGIAGWGLLQGEQARADLFFSRTTPKRLVRIMSRLL